MIPAEVWWHIMGVYGARIWPAQIVFYMVAILIMGWLLFKPGRLQSRITKLYLSIAFAWNGIFFFLILAKDITGDNYGNYFFGSIFIAVSVLFAIDLFREKMQFSLPAGGWGKHATLALLFLVFCYPLFGMALGHRFLRLIIPGTFPCPTAALGLLVLTTALPRVNKIAFILLLFWAIPFPPLIQIPKYGVYEDTVMFGVGIYGLVMLVANWKTDRTPNQAVQTKS